MAVLIPSNKTKSAQKATVAAGTTIVSVPVAMGVISALRSIGVPLWDSAHDLTAATILAGGMSWVFRFVTDMRKKRYAEEVTQNAAS